MDAKKPRMAFYAAPLFIVAVLIVLAVRYRTLDFVQGSLWAEDGHIFFNGANSLGLASLFEPFAGYLHLYPRLVALLSTEFNIQTIPYVFFIGWLIPIILLRWTIIKVFSESDHVKKIAFFLPIFLLLMPHSGETFLSLTNAQWWISISLALMVCAPEKFGKQSMPVIMLMALTGPFCLLFAPPCAIRSVQTKSYWVLAAILSASAIQIAFLLTSQRDSQALDPSIGNWFKFIKNLVLFGNRNALTTIASIAFWTSTIFIFLKTDSRYRALLACSAAAVIASAYAMKGSVGELSPYASGSRYFVIPFALISIATFTCLKKGRATSIACISLIIIFFGSKKLTSQQDMHFSAYAELSKYENTSIPLAPSRSTSPGFYMQVNQVAHKDHPESTYTLIAGTASVASDACSTESAIGFAGTVNILRPGYVTIRIETDGKDYEETRNYPAGAQRIQLATTKNKGPANIKITAENGILAPDIENAYYICI